MRKKLMVLLMVATITTTSVVPASAKVISDETKQSVGNVVSGVIDLITENAKDTAQNVQESEIGRSTVNAAVDVVNDLADTEVIKDIATKAVEIIKKVFSDVKNGDWFYVTVNKLTELGIIDGYTDGSFKPTGTVTVDAFVKMVVCGLGYTDVKPNNNGYWAENYINKAIELGIINSEEFNTTENITREQMALIISRALYNEMVDERYTVDNLSKYFSDWSKVTYKTELAKCLNIGVMSGCGDYKLNPKGTATRAEASSMIARMLDKSLRVTNNFDVIPATKLVQNIPDYCPKVYIKEVGGYMWLGMPVSEVEAMFGEGTSYGGHTLYYNNKAVSITLSKDEQHITSMFISKKNQGATFGNWTIGEQAPMPNNYTPKENETFRSPAMNGLPRLTYEDENYWFEIGTRNIGDVEDIAGFTFSANRPILNKLGIKAYKY